MRGAAAFVMMTATLALVAVTTACGPSKPPNTIGARRTGETVVTSCPDKGPSLIDDDAEHMSIVDKRMIERVCVLGALTEETRVAIVKALGFKEGDPLDPSKVRSGMEALVALKTIDDVIITADRRGDGVIVFVDVKERPKIDEVIFEGSKVFGDAKLSEQAKQGMEKGEVLDKRILNAMVQGMRDEYTVVGYGGAKIDPQIETVSKGHARVRFVIKEGPLWKIAKISFPGAAKVPEADLKHAVNMTEGAIFEGAKLERGAVLLQALYFDRGMIQARISDVKEEVASDGKVSVMWNIEEGDIFKVGTLKAGKPLGEKFQKEILQMIKTKPNMVFERSRFTVDQATITDFFLKQKNQVVEINPVTDIDATKKIVNITLEVIERPAQ
jgi:outer membrane protein insertion porin family